MSKEYQVLIEVAVLAIVCILQSYYAGKYARENKHLKEENSRLQIELLQQVNENLKIKNNISTDTVE